MSIRDKFKLGERFTFTFPGKEDVDAKTFGEIMDYVERACGSRCSDIVGSAWNDPENRYPGTLPKRIAKWIYRNKGKHLTESTVKTIGDMARANMVKNDTYVFDFDDKLAWNAGDFGDSYSCFMRQQEEGPIDVLRRYKSLAVRFYKDGGGIARAWIVFPDDTSGFSPVGWRDIAVMCNAYNSAQGLTLGKQAKIVGAFLGLGVKEITARNKGGEYFYTNSEDNYVLGLPDDIAPLTRVELRMVDYVPEPCYTCGKMLPRNHMYIVGEHRLCERCFREGAARCAGCGEYYLKAEGRVEGNRRYCMNCARDLTPCGICGDKYLPAEMTLFCFDGKDSLFCKNHATWYCEYPVALDGSCKGALFIKERPCRHYHYDELRGLVRVKEEWDKVPNNMYAKKKANGYYGLGLRRAEVYFDGGGFIEFKEEGV